MVDAFKTHIMQTKELGTYPVRQIGGCSFLYMRINNVYIVIVVSSNANAACALKFVVEVCIWILTSVSSLLQVHYTSSCVFSPRIHSVTFQITRRLLHLAYAHTTCHKHYVLKVPHDCNLLVEVTLHLLKHPTLVNTRGDFENSNLKKKQRGSESCQYWDRVGNNLDNFIFI